MAKVGYNFDFGMQLPNDPQWIQLTSTDETSVRLGIALPFKDLNIHDNVYTRTYFDGKLEFNFDLGDDGTTDLPDYDFTTHLAAIDIFEPDFDPDVAEQVQFDWATFDNQLATEGNTLVHRTLSECIDFPKTIYNSFDPDPASFNAENLNEGSYNTYSGTLQELFQWWDVNNYNSLVLLSSVKRTGAVVSDNLAKFYTNLYDLSLVHYVSFEAAFDSPMFVDAIGRVNTSYDIISSGDSYYFKYTGEEWLGSGDSLIEKPTDIIYHILEKEIGLTDIVDEIKLVQARGRCCVPKLAFSVNKEIGAKNLISDISSNSNIFPVFRANSEFSLNVVAEEYWITDVVETIKTRDIINYQFNRTPLEKINTLVNVKYKKDYSSMELKEETGYVDGYDMFGNKDSFLRNDLEGYSYSYFGLDRDDKILNFEAHYIRDEVSAVNLRNFLYMYNCNQNNEFSLEIPAKYLHLEVGDVINFDGLIDGLRAYGEDYTTPKMRNGQEIYPFFMISSIERKQKSIKMKATQLHNLRPNFQAHVGSITRSRGIKNGHYEPMEVVEEDLAELNLFLLGSKEHYTRGQKRVSDMNQNGYITTTDLFDLTELYIGLDTLLGDINGDGLVDVTDIVTLVTQILDETEMDILTQYFYDVNNDGVINVIDIIIIVNEILGIEE